jgi:glycosyltransferase involved in cell wall biosynthesis
MLVSVYMPTKNRLASLREAVASVLAQGHRELELIVVDDGSSDGTPDYLHQLSRTESRLRFVRHDVSAGPPAARNAGIRLARGEFVTGLDDDDRFLPPRIEAFVSYWDLLTRHGERPSCLYALDVSLVAGGRSVVTPKLGRIDYDAMFESNLLGNQIFAPRTHFLEAGLFDTALPLWQDLEFFMRVLQRFGPGRLLDMPTYVFDIRPRDDRVSVTSDERLRRAFELVAARHAADSGRRRQQLFLQMFSWYYGTRPSLRDFAYFMGQGVWVGGFARLVKKRVGVDATSPHAVSSN